MAPAFPTIEGCWDAKHVLLALGGFWWMFDDAYVVWTVMDDAVYRLIPLTHSWVSFSTIFGLASVKWIF